jgi:hypothetical protein
MVVELVIFGGKDEEKAVEEIRQIVAHGQRAAKTPEQTKRAARKPLSS